MYSRCLVETNQVRMIGSSLGIRDNQKDNLKSQSILSDQYVKLTVKNSLFHIAKEQKSKVQGPMYYTIQIRVLYIYISFYIH